ncbi:MAG: uroporphyrinogen-III C-methyltransferase [Gallionella sp.]|nr:uroporphyrinogen-III C-methyltransferase [Gallionella sp.]
MNEQTQQPEKVEPDIPAMPHTARKTPVADFFSRIGITQLMLVLLAAIFIWQWLDGHRAINGMQEQLAKKIAEMDGGSKASQILLAQSQDQVRELSAKVLAMETRYAEAQNQYAALETLYNDLSVSRDETALAEVEQMLLIAEQQLHLSANVKAALIAVQSADARLQRMNRPAFNGLRKVISQDMDKLRALPGVDVTGINFQLNNLIAAVDELPLAYQQRVADEKLLTEPLAIRLGEQTTPAKSPVMSGHTGEPIALAAPPIDETAWQKLLREIWQEAKQLVRIENTGKDEIPLLLPSQEYFLRENLKLRLLSARIALLSRDARSYSQELKTAQLWTKRYFDGKSDESARVLAGLKKLSGYDIGIELPDISPSLQAVRNFRLTREKAAR